MTRGVAREAGEKNVLPLPDTKLSFRFASVWDVGDLRGFLPHRYGREAAMDELCIGYHSGVALWREARRAADRQTRCDTLIDLLFDEGALVDRSALPVPTSLIRAPERVNGGVLGRVLDSERLLLDGPVDCLVSRQAGRAHVPGAVRHLCGGAYPAGSFCRTAEGALVACAPLCIVQVAPALGDVAVIELLSEFMGYFVPDAASPTGLRHAPPAFTAAEFRAWFSELARVRDAAGQRLPRGARRVRSLLELAVQRAASPGEARVALVLSLPTKMGGYGLPVPRLNAAIWLPAAAARAYGVDRFVCDLTWDDGTIVEYKGEAVHKQPSRRATDARKENILNHVGNRVIVVEKYQLASKAMTDEVALMVSERLRVPVDLEDPDFLCRQPLLRRDLLSSWVACERPAA